MVWINTRGTFFNNISLFQGVLVFVFAPSLLMTEMTSKCLKLNKKALQSFLVFMYLYWTQEFLAECKIKTFPFFPQSAFSIYTGDRGQTCATCCWWLLRRRIGGMCLCLSFKPWKKNKLSCFVSLQTLSEMRQ